MLNQSSVPIGRKAISPDICADLQLRDLATERARNLKDSDIVRIVSLLDSSAHCVLRCALLSPYIKTH